MEVQPDADRTLMYFFPWERQCIQKYTIYPSPDTLKVTLHRLQN